MRVDYIDYAGIYYTSFTSGGKEMNRLIKRLWRNPYYDFSFSVMPHCAPRFVYQINIAFNSFTERYDVTLWNQETVIANLACNSKITRTTSYSYGN